MQKYFCIPNDRPKEQTSIRNSKIEPDLGQKVYLTKKIRNAPNVSTDPTVKQGSEFMQQHFSNSEKRMIFTCGGVNRQLAFLNGLCRYVGHFHKLVTT